MRKRPSDTIEKIERRLASWLRDGHRLCGQEITDQVVAELRALLREKSTQKELYQ